MPGEKIEICPEMRVGNDGENGENLPKLVSRIFFWGCKERVAILAEKGIYSPKSYQKFKWDGKRTPLKVPILKKLEHIGEFGENSEDGENSSKSLEKVKLND